MASSRTLESFFYSKKGDSEPFTYHNHFLHGSHLRCVQRAIKPKEVGKYRLVLIEGTLRGRLKGIQLDANSEVVRVAPSCATAATAGEDVPSHYMIQVTGISPVGAPQRWQLALNSAAEQQLWLDGLMKASTHVAAAEKSGELAKLTALARKMKESLTVRQRLVRFKFYPRSFVGSAAVRWLMVESRCGQSEAVALGNQMLALNLLHHVAHEHMFAYKNLLYRFNAEVDPLVAGIDQKVDELGDNPVNSEFSHAANKLLTAYLRMKRELQVSRSALRARSSKLHCLLDVHHTQRVQLLRGRRLLLLLAAGAVLVLLCVAVCGTFEHLYPGYCFTAPRQLARYLDAVCRQAGPAGAGVLGAGAGALDAMGILEGMALPIDMGIGIGTDAEAGAWGVGGVLSLGWWSGVGQTEALLCALAALLAAAICLSGQPMWHLGTESTRANAPTGKGKGGGWLVASAEAELLRRHTLNMLSRFDVLQQNADEFSLQMNAAQAGRDVDHYLDKKGKSDRDATYINESAKKVNLEQMFGGGGKNVSSFGMKGMGGARAGNSSSAGVGGASSLASVAEHEYASSDSSQSSEGDVEDEDVDGDSLGSLDVDVEDEGLDYGEGSSSDEAGEGEGERDGAWGGSGTGARRTRDARGRSASSITSATSASAARESLVSDTSVVSGASAGTAGVIDFSRMQLSKSWRSIAEDIGSQGLWPNEPILVRRCPTMVRADNAESQSCLAQGSGQGSGGNCSSTQREVRDRFKSALPQLSLLQPLTLHIPGPLLLSEIHIDSDLFVGKAYILVNRLGDTPKGAFTKRSRRFRSVVQGRFKRPTPFSSVYTGQAFEHPLKQLPARWLLRGGIKMLSSAQPGLHLSLSGDRPFILSPLISTASTVSISCSSPPEITYDDVPEDMSLLGPAFEHCSAKKRQQYFTSKRSNLTSYSYDPKLVYTFDFNQQLVSFDTLQFDLGFMKFDLLKALGKNPIQVMALEWDPVAEEVLPQRLSYLYNFEIWHQKYFAANQHSSTPTAAQRQRVDQTTLGTAASHSASTPTSASASAPPPTASASSSNPPAPTSTLHISCSFPVPPPPIETTTPPQTSPSRGSPGRPAPVSASPTSPEKKKGLFSLGSGRKTHGDSSSWG